MKNRLWAFITALLCLATAEAQVTPAVQILPAGSDLDIQVGLIHLPRESPANPAVQSSTWVTAAQNAVNVLLAGSQSAGTNQYDTAARAAVLNWNKMLTSTAFQSWDSLVHSASGNNQWGNRAHFPVTVTSAKAGVTFRLADVTTTVRSLTRSSSGWAPDGAVNVTATLNTLNTTRLRLQPGGITGVVGDNVHPVQDPLVQSESCAFVGIGVALGAFGAGDSQAQLNNTLNYYRGGNFAVEVRVTVPYTDNGVAKTATGSTIFLATQTLPSEESPAGSTQAYCVGFGQNMTTITLEMPTGSQVPTRNLFALQKSTDLANWSSAGSPAMLGGQTVLSFATGEMIGTGPRCFYRIIDVLPPAGVVGRNFARSIPVLPLADVVVP